MIVSFPEVLNFNRLFLKLNWLIYNYIFLSNWCELSFGVTHCYIILPRVPFVTQITQVVSMHTEEYGV